MSKLHGWLLAALLPASLAASAADLPDSPQDYARGATLSLPQEASWYRVDLPQDVYATSAWPDLRDVRVFNQDGERVPFSLETQNTAASAPAAIPLRVFPLDASPVDAPEQGQNVVRLHAPSGIDIRIEGDDSKPIGQSYLLALPPDMPKTFTLAQLKLTWQEPVENWRSTVALFSSRDMRHWELLQEGAPIMALASGNDKLKLDQIHLNQRMSARNTQYLLLVFATGPLPVTISQATATLGSEPTSREQVQMESTGRQISPTEAQYQWAQPQPLHALTVKFERDSVLPVDIAWRSAAEGEWQSLGKTVLWQRDLQGSAPIQLAGEVVQAVRITTLDARLPGTLPRVVGSRDRQSILFNAQGKGPFMLAWGNRAAVQAAVTPDALIPPELRKQMNPSAIPRAQTQARMALGGEARMTATSPAERQGMWKTLLVWSALLLGVAVLVWMAVRIWREARSH
ncbi:DUF3999 family protein [Kosakonia sp. BYX6]|uniref:DUF3999 family protein n=1 Tax=Kosakonia calanthes TaxID=3139408 RepID=A0ABZ3B208_9ENTR